MAGCRVGTSHNYLAAHGPLKEYDQFKDTTLVSPSRSGKEFEQADLFLPAGFWARTKKQLRHGALQSRGPHLTPETPGRVAWAAVNSGPRHMRTHCNTRPAATQRAESLVFRMFDQEANLGYSVMH